MNTAHKVLLIAVCMLFSGHSNAAINETSLARQGIDQLMNTDLAAAQQSFHQLEKRYPDYPLNGLMQISIVWAQAELASEEKLRDIFLDQSADKLKKHIQLAREKSSSDPENRLWKLALGSSLAQFGLVSLRQNNFLQAYSSGREGRDILRQLIQEHPDIEDAYTVLGLYELQAGSVPTSLSWLTSLLDLSGDQKLGLAYVNRAIKHAPLFAPEAARLLLKFYHPRQKESCIQRPLVKQMHRRYPKNPTFAWMNRVMEITCQ